MMYRYGIIHN